LKLDIRRKVLLLVLSGSLLTFLLLAVFLTFGLYHAGATLDRENEELGGEIAGFTEELVEAQIKKRMEEITRLRAQHVDLGVMATAADVKYLADVMNVLLKSDVQSSADPLPNALYIDVPAGLPFIHYSPDLAGHGISPALQREIRLTSGIIGSLLGMSNYCDFYQAVYLGSKNGYTIMIQQREEKEILSALCTEPLRHTYDPRKRDWYILGKGASKPLFTDVYTNPVTGEPNVSCVFPYYDTGGFGGVVGIDISVQDIYEQIRGTAISSTERSFVMGKKGEIIISSKEKGLLSVSLDSQDLRKSSESSIAREAANMVAGKTDIKPVTVDGKEYYLAYAPIKSMGWSFGTLIAKDETLSPALEAKTEVREWMEDFRNTMRGQLTGYGAVLAAAMALLLAGLIGFGTWSAKRFVKPILELEDGVKQIAQGNLDKTLSLQTGDEIERLADSVNNMAAELKTHIADISHMTAEKERIATELSVARNIQEGMLPKTFPAFPDKKEFDIYASMHAAKEVGGDFYDFYLVDADHLAVAIGDVSGKGVPAALFMVAARTVLQNNMFLLKKAEALGEIMARANDRLCQNNEEDMFVTVFMGLLDIRSGEFCYVNAGHNRPMLRRGTAGFTSLPKADTCMMGLMEGLEFPVRRLQLNQGDCLFLYTDGVTEAMDEEGKLFSEEKLITVLDAAPAEAEAQDILRLVSEEVKAHAGNAEQSDDVTMLGLIYKGRINA
jgi:sigma-B regulation protein RsbU (phosphoserine phosphatase)